MKWFETIEWPWLLYPSLMENVKYYDDYLKLEMDYEAVLTSQELNEQLHKYVEHIGFVATNIDKFTQITKANSIISQVTT